jgi:hypothetical protein
MRQVGDREADEFIGQLFDQGHVGKLNLLWDFLKENNQPLPPDLSQEVKRFLDDTEKWPSWADADLIKRGEKVFRDHGVFALIALLCTSLPECYVMRNGIQVLWTTQQLEAHVYRRLFETAQMLVAVMDKDGLSTGGGGIIAAQKVRCLHAGIRHLILKPRAASATPSAQPKDFSAVLENLVWDQAKLGYPINQEDMAYTLMTFSYVILRAMEDMGVELTDDERDAYIHCWNVVGHIMGLHDDMMPQDFAAAKSLFEQIKRLEGAASPEGRSMTRAVLDCLRRVLDFPVLDRLPHIMARHLVDEATAEWLGVPKLTTCERWVQGCFLWLMDLLNKLERGVAKRSIFGGMIRRWLGWRLVKRLTHLPKGWEKKLFDIPPELGGGWKKMRLRKAPDAAAKVSSTRPAPRDPKGESK